MKYNRKHRKRVWLVDMKSHWIEFTRIDGYERLTVAKYKPATLASQRRIIRLLTDYPRVYFQVYARINPEIP